MKTAVLCFLVKNKGQDNHGISQQVLLGVKRSRIGAGKLNGIGGRAKENEDPGHAAVREVFEEAKVRVLPENLIKVGEMTFRFPIPPTDTGKDMFVHVFLAHEWQGEPQETKEMGKYAWFDSLKLPFDEMMPGDKHWIPLILEGRCIVGRIDYGEGGRMVLERDINIVNPFTESIEIVRAISF